MPECIYNSRCHCVSLVDTNGRQKIHFDSFERPQPICIQNQVALVRLLVFRTVAYLLRPGASGLKPQCSLSSSSLGYAGQNSVEFSSLPLTAGCLQPHLLCYLTASSVSGSQQQHLLLRFHAEDLDKERGAIMEEWRGLQGSSGRTQFADWKSLLAGSKAGHSDSRRCVTVSLCHNVSGQTVDKCRGSVLP